MTVLINPHLQLLHVNVVCESSTLPKSNEHLS